MPKRNIVWVFDQSGSEYAAAQALLATKDIDLLIFSRDELGLFSRQSVEKTIKQFGAPNLLIAGAEYSAEEDIVLSVLNSELEIWNDSRLSTNNPTDLIDALALHFLTVELKTKIELDKKRNIVEINGQKIKLTSRELEILDHLLIAPDHTVARTVFFDSVWSGLKVCNKVLDVHVSNLRKKVQPYGIKIRFVQPGSFEIVFPEEQSGNLPKSAPEQFGPVSA